MDNKVIIEEFRINNAGGDPIFSGITTRSYNQNTKKWVMGFFDALNPEWYPLEQPQKESNKIVFYGRFPGLKENQKLRITFYDIKKKSFKWKSDLSNDNGVTWVKSYTLISATLK